MQDKLRQGKARQDKARLGKARQGKRGQEKAGRCRARQFVQVVARQDMAGKAGQAGRQFKIIQDKAR
jgi:hypothetical protein